MKKTNAIVSATFFVLTLLSSYSETSWSQEKQSAQGTAKQLELPLEVAQTLQQAKQDLLSESEQRRVSAAILLGKYKYSQSQQLLLIATDDVSPAVRRSAVVSLREQAYFTTKADIENILMKLGDKDVEVRRAISSMVGNLGMQLSHFTNIALPPGQRYALPPDLKKVVITAFSDVDAIVRLNIVKSFFRLNLVLPPEIAISLLKDPQTEIVVAALQILKTIALTENILDQIDRLADSEDYHIQVALVENLIDSKDERILAQLVQLTDSDKPYFKFTHYILKARHGDKVNKDEVNEVISLLSTFKKRTVLLEKLIKDIHLFGSEAINLALVHHTLVGFRLSGWGILLKKGISDIDRELLLLGLHDTTPTIRQTVVNFLLQTPEQVPDKLIERMISSPTAAVRIAAAEVFVRLPVMPPMQHVLTLLVDETAQVRASALRVMVRHRPANWKKILQRSLHDRDFSVQKQSVSQLFGRGQEGIGIIQAYAQENSETALAQYIRAEFVRRKIRLVPIAAPKSPVTEKE